MFASIPNYMDFYSEAEIHQGGVTCLKILNEIIAAFDKVSNLLSILKVTLLEKSFFAASIWGSIQPSRKDQGY